MFSGILKARNTYIRSTFIKFTDMSPSTCKRLTFEGGTKVRARPSTQNSFICVMQRQVLKIINTLKQNSHSEQAQVSRNAHQYLLSTLHTHAHSSHKAIRSAHVAKSKEVSPKKVRLRLLCLFSEFLGFEIVDLTIRTTTRRK